MAAPATLQFEKLLTKTAPYMARTVEKGRTFSSHWEDKFEETLATLFGDDEERMQSAIKGYVRFALEVTKLQKQFEKERRYIPKTYAEAAAEVYHNEDYMHNLYLPGILLSQYLWPHHYNQQQFFLDQFVPKIRAAENKRFADVGIGTGFFSRLALAADPGVTGVGFDISDSSLSYALMHVEKFGFQDRWTPDKRDVLTSPPEEKFPFVISVEVLEHLDDPVSFLKGLKAIMAPGGYGFITAAMTAPLKDHIYLYNETSDVMEHLHQAGFEVVTYQEDVAYEPKAGEPVPRISEFIVR